MIEEIRERLRAFKGAVGLPDSRAMATQLANSYPFTVEEIRVLVIEEAKAAGVQLIDGRA
ncbi:MULTISPECIES: hypothetical protein [unclassified Bradyrhizobium]|nr:MULTISPECIES: hypothetical protein [unclassified Bradyrhizobium]